MEVLLDADKALKEAGIPYHLHSGTALGSIRSGSFIEHDSDIDLGVFRGDYNNKLIKAMTRNGFERPTQNGILKFGKEYTFYHKKTGVNLDIFLVYEDTVKGEPIYWVASFYGSCDDKKYGLCRWAYRPYVPEPVILNGHKFMTMPVSAIEDAYGPSWRIPKQFGYYEGVDQGHYTNLISE